MKFPILKLFYLFGFVNSVSILKQIVAGQTYYGLRIDMNKINGKESWPAKMRLRLNNYGYFCQMPSVNLSSSAIETDKECLIKAWNLPANRCPSSPIIPQLSPIMREIGGCHLAAEEMAKNGIYFDADKCNCVGWWPIILFALALFNCGFNASRLFWSFRIDENDLMLCARRITNVHICASFAIIVVLIFYTIDIIDIGVLFTVDGAGFSRNYYNKAIEWMSISNQASFGFVIESMTSFYR